MLSQYDYFINIENIFYHSFKWLSKLAAAAIGMMY